MTPRPDSYDLYLRARTVVAERILAGLVRSPQHASLSAMERIKLAYKLADTEIESASAAPDEVDEIAETP